MLTHISDVLDEIRTILAPDADKYDTAAIADQAYAYNPQTQEFNEIVDEDEFWYIVEDNELHTLEKATPDKLTESIIHNPGRAFNILTGLKAVSNPYGEYTLQREDGETILKGLGGDTLITITTQPLTQLEKAVITTIIEEATQYTPDWEAMELYTGDFSPLIVKEID